MANVAEKRQPEFVRGSPWLSQSLKKQELAPAATLTKCDSLHGGGGGLAVHNMFRIKGLRWLCCRGDSCCRGSNIPSFRELDWENSPLRWPVRPMTARQGGSLTKFGCAQGEIAHVELS